MNNVLKTYFQGITQKMRAEVDFINSLFDHQGLKGEGNEAILRDLLVKFIPQRYGIGSGVVIDRNGKASRQCDIIIYDTFLYPSLFSLASVHLFPVDIVYAVIEIKTTLTSNTASIAIQNIESVKNLDYIKEEFGTYSSDKDQLSLGIKATSPPIGIIFAFNSDSVKDETFKKWFIPDDNDNIESYPSLVGCLDIGLVGFKKAVDSPLSQPIALHPIAGMIPVCLTFPIVKQKNEDLTDAKSPDDVIHIKLDGTDLGNQTFSFEGVNYPIKKIGDDYMPIDQSRVLINFLLLLNDLLSLKKIHPSIRFTETYLRNIDRFHFVC